MSIIILSSSFGGAPPPPCPSITLAPSTLPSGVVGVPYRCSLSATGGTSPYTYRISSGTLPAGLTLSTGGLLAGTPTGAQTATVTVHVTDAQGCPGSLPATIPIAVAPPAPPPPPPPAPCPTLTITPAALPGATVGVPYSTKLVASGGTGPYTFAVVLGTLPAGVALSSIGLFSGTPTVGQTTPLTIQVTDANGCPGSLVAVIVVSAPTPPIPPPTPPPGPPTPPPPGPPPCPTITIAPATLPPGTVGVPYGQALQASGGTAPYTYAVASGTLPVGLTLSSIGGLGGIPTTPVTTTVIIHATDANGCPGLLTLTLQVAAAPLPPPPPPPPAAGLMAAANFVYQGAFRLAQVTNDGDPVGCLGCFPDFNFGSGLTYWPAHNSLLMANLYHFICEQAVATPSLSAIVGDLPRATVLQAPVAPSGAALTTAIDGVTPLDQHGVGGTYWATGWNFAGFFVRASDLLVSVATDYDAAQSQRLNMITMPQTLASPGAAGAFQVGTVSVGGSTAGITAGWMIPIPAAYQASFGGADLLIGGGPKSIIARCSLGPAATVLKSTDVGVVTPPSSTLVLAYPQAHPTLGPYGGSGAQGFDDNTRIVGAVWIPGTPTILFFGRKGTQGNQAYGPGTAVNDGNSFPPTIARVWALVNPNPGGATGEPVDTQGPAANIPPAIPINSPTGPPVDGIPCWPLACTLDGPYPSFSWCYDPVSDAEGDHGYPYVDQVWAYDARDLAAVYAGSKNYWEPVPYAYWNLAAMNGGLPIPWSIANNPRPAGVTIDPVGQRVFVATAGYDGSANPLILQFTYTLPA